MTSFGDKPAPVGHVVLPAAPRSEAGEKPTLRRACMACHADDPPADEPCPRQDIAHRLVRAGYMAYPSSPEALADLLVFSGR